MRNVRRVEGESGQAVIIVAIMMVVMLGMLGLIIDGGLLLIERRSAQSAADAAAIAAALDLVQGHSAASATASARYYAAQNGYNNDGTTNTVNVSIPPTSGPWAGNSNFAQVIITQTLTTFFIQVAYSGLSTASALATAGITNVPAPYALIALNHTACGALTVNGNGKLEVEGAGDDERGRGIMVNSSCASALRVTGNAKVEAGFIHVVGGYQTSGNPEISPLPQTGRSLISDPLAGLNPPDLASLPVRNGTAANPVNYQINGNEQVDLLPGIYYGGISISGNARVNLRDDSGQPGIYVMAGGGLSVTGNGQLNGDNVFIYNTIDTTNPFGAGDYGSIDLTGNGNVHLTPPTSGPYEGLLFFQDRNNNKPFKVAGNGELDDVEQGTLYFPSAACEFTGNGHEAEASQVICDTISISGNGELEIEYEDDDFYAPPTATLVE